jgi:protein phosphatase
MILRAAASTHVGRRRRMNEDRYALAPDLGLYLVADGMGGHTAGQVASEMAADAALRAVRTLQGASASLAEKLRYAVTSANREIYQTGRQRPELAGMGTTLVSVLAFEGRAALAHVGDSRAYPATAGPTSCAAGGSASSRTITRSWESCCAAARSARTQPASIPTATS